VKASSDFEEYLEEEKLRRGSDLAHRLTPGDWVPDSDAEQSPEGEARGRGKGGQLPLAESRQRREGKERRKAVKAADEEKAPEERKPWTWQRGEIDPQGQPRRKPSRTCETSRTARHRVWKARGIRRGGLRSRRGTANPKEGALYSRATGAQGGPERGSTLKRREA
jgi:hypothetical protein